MFKHFEKCLLGYSWAGQLHLLKWCEHIKLEQHLTAGGRWPVSVSKQVTNPWGPFARTKWTAHSRQAQVVWTWKQNYIYYLISICTTQDKRIIISHYHAWPHVTYWWDIKVEGSDNIPLIVTKTVCFPGIMMKSWFGPQEQICLGGGIGRRHTAVKNISEINISNVWTCGT